jgi:hypothetical protein
MPSTFSPSLRLELIGSGEQSGVWGNTTNNNLGDLIEQAISGVADLNVTVADITLTALNGVTDQSRSAVLSIIGTAGTTRTVTIPNVAKAYTVKNRSDATVNIKTSAGTAFSVPTLAESYIYCDGDNVVTGRSISTNGDTLISAVNPSSVAQSLGIAPTLSPTFTGTPVAPTAIQGTNTTQVATTAFVNAEIAADTANLAPLNSPSLTGTPTAPTAAVTTNTTQLATTAFVNAEIANDAPTKTGGGASGTWGINITGNSATATNATNATNATTAVTQSFGTNDTSIATTAFVNTALQAVFPVGSVYINASVATSPATLFGFGTWAEIGAGRVLVGQNVGDASFDVLGETGGSKDATLVAHAHTGSGTTASTSINHTHTFNANTGTASANHVHGVNDPGHAHTYVRRLGLGGGGGIDQPAGALQNVSTTDAFTNISLTASGADHFHGVGGTTGATDPSHNHTFSFTTASQGSSATNANLQPYLVVKMWQRTA